MPTGKDFDLNPSIEMMDELVGTQGRLVRSNSSSAKPTIRRNFTVLGFSSLPSQSWAQAKTAKACTEEWRADKAGFQAKGIPVLEKRRGPRPRVTSMGVRCVRSMAYSLRN